MLHDSARNHNINRDLGLQAQVFGNLCVARQPQGDELGSIPPVGPKQRMLANQSNDDMQRMQMRFIADATRAATTK